MKKIKILVFTLMILSQICIAQKKAITETGDEVILYENGTWKYTKEFNQDDSNFIKTNPQIFSKSKNASFLLKAKHGNIGFWIDPKKWTFGKGVSNPDADFELGYKGQSLVGVIISESAEIPIESYVEIALLNGRIASPDLKLINKEYRIVNGIKVLQLKMEGTQVGVKFNYWAYYFTNETATVQFLVASYTNEMVKYAKEVEELLNGIVEINPDADAGLKNGEDIIKSNDTLAQGSSSPFNKCTRFFTGKWKYVVNNQTVEVERTMEKTIEYMENRKYKYEYVNKWIDSCNYELIFVKTNKPDFKLEKPGESMLVEILQIDKKIMKYSVSFRGIETAAEMKKTE